MLPDGRAAAVEETLRIADHHFAQQSDAAMASLYFRQMAQPASTRKRAKTKTRKAKKTKKKTRNTAKKPAYVKKNPSKYKFVKGRWRRKGKRT
jgi:hypothetical protein